MKKNKIDKQRNNLGESLELLDPPKRLEVIRLQLYLGREPRKV